MNLTTAKIIVVARVKVFIPRKAENSTFIANSIALINIIVGKILQCTDVSIMKSVMIEAFLVVIQSGIVIAFESILFCRTRVVSVRT